MEVLSKILGSPVALFIPAGSVFGIVVGIIMMVITVVFAVDIIRRIHGGD